MAGFRWWSGGSGPWAGEQACGDEGQGGMKGFFHGDLLVVWAGNFFRVVRR